MSRSKKLTRAAALAAAAIMTFAAGACGGEEQTEETPSSSADAENSTSDTAPAESTTTSKTTMAPIVTTTTTTTLPPLPVMEEYKEDVDKNSDVVGHIRIPGTPIDFNVVQYLDNKFYLSHGYEKEDLRNGVPFVDWQCQFTTRTRPANIIIYGHNMINGPSFAKVTTYCPWYYSGYNKSGTNFSIKQYTENPVIYFDTIWEKGSYKVFAGMFVNAGEKSYDGKFDLGDVFYYFRQRTIANEGEFYDYIGNIMDRSQFYTDVDLEYGDELLTLSTCYYPFGENIDTRFVLFARRVREGESEEVDTSKAYINTDPLYFDYFYKVYGGSWGGRTWDTSKVKGFDEYYKTHETTASTTTE